MLYDIPHSTISVYQKGEIIYCPEEPSTSLYLLNRGRVKVSRISHTGNEMVIDIYQKDELFGESALANPSLPRSDQATALERAIVLVWPVSTIEHLIATNPWLGIALLREISQRKGILSTRLLSFAAETNGQRLIRELLRLSERLGTRENDGSIRMMPITQALLAQYIGSSREIVTCYMNRLREDGCLRYSRKEIIVYPEALKTHLQGDNN